MPRYVVRDHPKFPRQCVVFDTYINKPILMPGTGQLPEDDNMDRDRAVLHAANLNRVYELLHPFQVRAEAAE